MALASYNEARSPVELSLSPVYQYQYSSISKCLDRLCRNEEDRRMLREKFQRLSMSYFDNTDLSHYLLQTDTTSLCKRHSPTLPGRTFVSAPKNAVGGNRPVDIGYEASSINLCDPEGNWSLPLAFRRVMLEETSSDCAIEQLSALFSDDSLDFADKLVINTCDSKYGNAEYLSRAYDHSQMVHVVRLRAGLGVWTVYDGAQRSNRKRFRGEKHYLHRENCLKSYKKSGSDERYEVFQQSIFGLPASDHHKLEMKTKKGRDITVELWRFNDLLIRSKTGYDMKNKPIDIVVVEACDKKSGEPLFSREMYLGISGCRKSEIGTIQAHESYQRRFGVEHYYRFAKQRLLLQRYQTPDIEHLDNWLLIQQITPWLLYAASDETDKVFRKWEQYLPENKIHKPGERLTISRTRRALQNLFLTLDLTPFKPSKSKKGKGRAKGHTAEPRKRYGWVKKTAYKRKNKQKNEQIE